MPANLLSAAGGPLLAAWLRDVTGSYQLPYSIFFVVAIIGTFFIFLARPPVKQRQGMDLLRPAG
jgi:cyanate permease